MAENKTDKIIIGIFVAVIIIAVGVFAYYNMYNPSSPSEKENVLLTLSYGNEYHNYTLSDLKKIDSFSGNGGYFDSNNDLISKNKGAINWGRELFKYYQKQSHRAREGT